MLSRGKHLFIRVGRASIHSHLKMDGSWRVGAMIQGRVPVDHRARIILEASSVRAVGVDLGALEVLDRDHDGDADRHLGPDPLGEDWDPRVAAANLTARPNRSMAEALLDERVLAGVGNVYCNELFFVTGHLPIAPVNSITDAHRLVSRARDMLSANRLRWNRCTTGDTRAGQQLWVYGQADKAAGAAAPPSLRQLH